MSPEQAEKWLPRKRPAVVITNACNMTCGACHQFCGQFRKDQMFFISIDQFNRAVEVLTRWAENLKDIPPITIYGGEPTIHPQWDKLVEIMLANDHLPFTVFTNGLWLTGNNPTLKDIRNLETGEHVESFVEVDLSKESLYHGRKGFLNTLQTKPETQLLEEFVNRQGFVCDCGHGTYEFVAYHGIYQVGYYETAPSVTEAERRLHHFSMPIYYRCVNCGKTYKLSQSRIQDWIIANYASDELREKISSLPYDPLPQWAHAFRWEEIQSITKNIGYRIDSKTRDTIRFANPVAVAPADLWHGSKRYFWDQARSNCNLWKGCETSIYDDKAYFCIVAGAMDRLFYDGKYGWPIEEGKNPFLRSREEIDSQAENFCYRCGFACNQSDVLRGIGEKQMVFSETLTTPTNYRALKRARLVRNARDIPFL